MLIHWHCSWIFNQHVTQICLNSAIKPFCQGHMLGNKRLMSLQFVKNAEKVLHKRPLAHPRCLGHHGTQAKKDTNKALNNAKVEIIVKEVCSWIYILLYIINLIKSLWSCSYCICCTFPFLILYITKSANLCLILFSIAEVSSPAWTQNYKQSVSQQRSFFPI